MKMNKIKCIAGLVWELNPNEGPAWIKKFVTPEYIIKYDDNDIIFRFKYCPVCGKFLDVNKEKETLNLESK